MHFCQSEMGGSRASSRADALVGETDEGGMEEAVGGSLRRRGGLVIDLPVPVTSP